MSIYRRSLIGRLGLEKYSVECIIGLTETQRENKQRLLITLLVEADIQEVAKVDTLVSGNSVDNARLAQIIDMECARGYRTLEALGYNLHLSVYKDSELQIAQRVTTIINKENTFGSTVERLKSHRRDFGVARL